MIPLARPRNSVNKHKRFVYDANFNLISSADCRSPNLLQPNTSPPAPAPAARSNTNANTSYTEPTISATEPNFALIRRKIWNVTFDYAHASSHMQRNYDDLSNVIATLKQDLSPNFRAVMQQHVRPMECSDWFWNHERVRALEVYIRLSNHLVWLKEREESKRARLHHDKCWQHW